MTANKTYVPETEKGVSNQGRKKCMDFGGTSSAKNLRCNILITIGLFY